MLCSDIIDQIEEIYPKSAALGFDNVGLLVGRGNKEVKKIYLALDATDEVVEDAVNNGVDLLITHHPLIFSGMKSVTDRDFIGRRVIKLIQSDISYYAMHTNYDVLGMAELANTILGLKDSEVLDVTAEINERPEGIGRVGNLERERTVRECCEYVKEKLALDNVRVFGDLEQRVQRMAISPGSGKSAIKPALKKGAQVLVTGDIGHHEGIDAAAQGLTIIDAGHYGTEYIFIEDMKTFLENKWQDVDVIAATVKHPFQVI